MRAFLPAAAAAVNLTGDVAVIVWVIIAIVLGCCVFWAVNAARTSGPYALVPLLLAVLVALLVLLVAGVLPA
jgi:hypothetical protein